MKNQPKLIPINDLLLDPENPRLPLYVERTQHDMLEFLAKTSSIEELMSAISENDFFPAEALVAVPSNDKYIVVEGNRRLTALKLLSGETFDEIAPRIVELQSTARYKPIEVPVSVFDQRSEILNYLGNRHISGVKPWGALAKARYINQLYDQTDAKQSFAERCKTVAKVIGSRRDFISKSMRAYNLYELAEKRAFFGIPNLDEKVVKFSLISTAVDYEGVQDFLYGSIDEYTPDGEVEKTADPEKIKELFTWLFVKDDENRVRLGESRNLNKLSKILLNDEALYAFRHGATVEQAYILTRGVEEDFDTICAQIQRDLREANSIAADVEINDYRSDLTHSIAKQAKKLERGFSE